MVRCNLECLHIPDNHRWQTLDVRDNPRFRMDDGSKIQGLRSVNIARTACDIAALIQSAGVVDLQQLIADDLVGGEAFFDANALLSLKRLSFRGGDIPVLDFLSNHALLHVGAIDLGKNKMESAMPAHLCAVWRLPRRLARTACKTTWRRQWIVAAHCARASAFYVVWMGRARATATAAVAFAMRRQTCV